MIPIAAIHHDILDFCVRELVALSGGGVEEGGRGSEVAPQRLGHLPFLTGTADLVVNRPIVTSPAIQGLIVKFVWIAQPLDVVL